MGYRETTASSTGMPQRQAASAPGSVPLNDGHALDLISFGTWPMDDTQTAAAVQTALRYGYRHFDTAQRYHNEYGVGAGLRASGLARSQFTVASKLRGGDQGAAQARRAFLATKRNLGLGPIDLYFIHWPLPRLDQYVESWRTLIELRDEGHIRSIGVCNFEREHLERLQAETGVLPAVNQIELHVGWRQEELREVCAQMGIAVQAWGPLGRGKGLLDSAQIREVATRNDVTPGQVALTWLAQQGIASVPKSANEERIAQNIDLGGLTLSEEDIAQIATLPQERVGKDPRTTEEY